MFIDFHVGVQTFVGVKKIKLLMDNRGLGVLTLPQNQQYLEARAVFNCHYVLSHHFTPVTLDILRQKYA